MSGIELHMEERERVKEREKEGKREEEKEREGVREREEERERKRERGRERDGEKRERKRERERDTMRGEEKETGREQAREKEREREKRRKRLREQHTFAHTCTTYARKGEGSGGRVTDFDGHWVVADDQEIFGLQIEMNDVFLVHVNDAFEDLAHYALHLLLREGALNQSLEELAACHILHHQHIRVSVFNKL